MSTLKILNPKIIRIRITNKIRKGSEFFPQTLIFPIPISLQDVNLWYLKLRLFDLTELIVWKIKDQRH